MLGYVRANALPNVTTILGFVLGEMLEQNLRRALSISNGNMAILWESSVTKVLLVMAVAVIVIPPLLRILRKRHTKPQVDVG